MAEGDDFLDEVLNNSLFDENVFDEELKKIPEGDGNEKGKSSIHSCKACGKTFTRAYNLTRHNEKNVCSEVRTFICKHCGKHFKKMGYLIKHEKDNACDKGKLITRLKPKAKKSSTDINKVPAPLNYAKRFKCERCSHTFSSKFNLKRHSKSNSCTSTGIDRVFTCKWCSKKFSSTNTLKKHMRTHASDSGNSASTSNCPQDKFNHVFTCKTCSKKFSSRAYLDQHVRTHDQSENIAKSDKSNHNNDNILNGKNNGQVYDDENSESDNDDDRSFMEDIETEDGDGFLPQRRSETFDGNLARYMLNPLDAEKFDLMYFLRNRRPQLRANIIRELGRLQTIKWYTCIKVKMDRLDMDGNVVDTAEPVFRSRTEPALSPDVIDGQINVAFQKMIGSLDAFKAAGSGWILGSVIHMELTVVRYNPLRGACCQFKVPEVIARKQCIVNVTGPPELDGECFRYAVLAALNTEADHIGNLPWSNLHKYKNTLRFDGITDFGRHMPVTNIPVFEKLNNISINVYGYENCDVFPVYISKTVCIDKHVNLLLFEKNDKHDEKDEVENFDTIAKNRSLHYCVIKDMGRLLSSQMDRNNRVHICMKCLSKKTTAEDLAQHQLNCAFDEDHIRHYMPSEKEKWLKFRNYGRKMKVSFVIYACFGLYTTPIYDNNEATFGFQVRERRLDPCAYSYQRISVDDSYPTAVQYYRGSSPEDTMQHFLQAMQEEEEEVFQIQQNIAPMNRDEIILQAPTDECFVCKDTFLPSDRTGWDHSHVSGKIRGRVHCDSCNLRLKEANFLPVFLQNLSQMEGRLIMQAIGKFGARKVQVIPQTIDTYVSITVSKCRYLDFSRFLKADLNELVTSLAAKAGNKAFKCTRQLFNEDQIDAIIKPLIFCFDYLDDTERLREDKLPNKEAFYDRINDRHVTEQDYIQAKNVWDTFQISTLEDYLRHFLKRQCLLFADVVEHFRDTLMQDFGLDCAWYYSLPGFSWDACLHHTDLIIELIRDESMHQKILHGIRGGMTHVGCPRIARANNPDMSDFNPNLPTSYIHFVDCNNQYASVMSDFALPSYGFRYLSSYELDRLNIMDIQPDAHKGYIFTVDLEIPVEMHVRHDKYPMAPENTIISPSDFSEYTSKLAERCGFKLSDERKLCLTLRPKKEYTVHYLLLQHYVSHGLEITKIHSAIEFTQTRSLKNFIDFTCKKRRQATNPFDDMLYKNVANNTFGKTIENVFKRIKVKICTSSDDLNKIVRKPSFQAIRVFSDNVAVVQQYHDYVKLNKPIAIGFSILELSKLRMYEFFYDFLLKEFPEESVNLLYSDTDSFLFQINNVPNVNEVMWRNRRLFDFSSLPDGHNLKDDRNKKVPGKMKLQLGSSVLVESVVLSSKTYSVLTDNGEKTHAKGVHVKLNHDRYKECLESEMSYQKNIKSVKHYDQNMYHVSTKRTLLSPVETKRYYVDANQSYSFGHYFIDLLKILDEEMF